MDLCKLRQEPQKRREITVQSVTLHSDCFKLQEGKIILSVCWWNFLLHFIITASDEVYPA